MSSETYVFDMIGVFYWQIANDDMCGVVAKRNVSVLSGLKLTKFAESLL